MSICRTIVVALGLSAFVLVPAVKSGELPVAPPPGVLPIIEAFIQQQSVKRAPPALSVSIGRNGALVYAAGFGEASKGQRADAQTVYKIGSITKQFTAAAILRMIETGARPSEGSASFDLDTPVANLLQGADAWRREDAPPITVRNLLSMTSSLPNFTRRPPKDLDPWGAIPAQRLLGELKGLQPSGFPGSFEYSNTSYFLLSEILSTLQVSGRTRTYQALLKNEIFEKLGLRHTGFADDSALNEYLAVPHYNRRPAFDKPAWLQGSADIFSSVSDLFEWNKAVMDGQLLTRPMRDAMFSDAARVDVWTYYGMGWFVRHRGGREEYSHSGSVPGYTALNLIDSGPDGDWISVSILANSDGIEGFDEMAAEIAASVRNHTGLTLD